MSGKLKLRPLYPSEKCSRCSLAGSVIGSQKWCGCFWKRNSICPCQTSNHETPVAQPLTWSLYRCPLPAPWTDMTKIMRTFWNSCFIAKALKMLRNSYTGRGVCTVRMVFASTRAIGLLRLHTLCAVSFFHFVVACSPFFFTASPTSAFLGTSTFHSLL